MKNTILYPYWEYITPKTCLEKRKRLFNQVIENYKKPNRFYHNLDHLRNIFVQLDGIDLEEKEKKILVAVTFFHDVIYKVFSKRNEEKSAIYAERMLRGLKWGESDIQEVCSIILDTKTHQAFSFLSEVFQDMDLAVLGISPYQYIDYRDAIRKEYACIPDWIYRKGRRKCLQELLERNFLFIQEEYRRNFETRARENIKNEIKHYENTTN